MTSSNATADPAPQGPDVPPLTADYLDRYLRGLGATPANGQTAALGPALRRMHLHHEPFVFATIDSFLPQELYDALLVEWPPEPSFTAVALSGDGYFGSRKQRVAENTATGATLDTPAWAAARGALRDPGFVSGLFAAFGSIVEANLTDLGPSASGPPCFKLYANVDSGMREALGAHVDALAKLLTIVIYLDLSGKVTAASPAQWGTTLYTADLEAAQPLQFTANAGRPAARQVEFAPNRAFVMPNALGALHGVCGGEADVTRRTLMCGYYLQQPP
jgi:hypothetical protein